MSKTVIFFIILQLTVKIVTKEDCNCGCALCQDKKKKSNCPLCDKIAQKSNCDCGCEKCQKKKKKN